MKFSNTIKTVLKIYPKYVKNSVWFGTGTSSYRSAEPELLLWRQSFSFGTDVVHEVWLTGQ